MSYNDVIRSAEITVLRLSKVHIESVISVYETCQYIRNEINFKTYCEKII